MNADFAMPAAIFSGGVGFSVVMGIIVLEENQGWKRWLKLFGIAIFGLLGLVGLIGCVLASFA